MVHAASRSRAEVLRRKIEKLELDLSASKRELRNINGGFGRGRAAVDRAWDKMVAERHAAFAGKRGLVGRLAQELGVSVRQLSRVVHRHQNWIAKHPPHQPSAPPTQTNVSGQDERSAAMRTLLLEITSKLGVLVRSLGEMSKALSTPDMFGPEAFAVEIRKFRKQLLDLIDQWPAPPEM